jgi:hypothetical protein
MTTVDSKADAGELDASINKENAISGESDKDGLASGSVDSSRPIDDGQGTEVRQIETEPGERTIASQDDWNESSDETTQDGIYPVESIRYGTGECRECESRSILKQLPFLDNFPLDYDPAATARAKAEAEDEEFQEWLHWKHGHGHQDPAPFEGHHPYQYYYPQHGLKMNVNMRNLTMQLLLDDTQCHTAAYRFEKRRRDFGGNCGPLVSLMEMTGLEEVKHLFLDLKQKIDIVKARKGRLRRGELNIVITGNPGTGAYSSQDQLMYHVSS